jgi:hypothetical protein
MFEMKSLSKNLDAELRERASQEPSLRGFAYTVHCLEDLGFELGKALESYLEPDEIVQGIVVLPRQRLLLRGVKRPNKSLFAGWKLTPEIILLHTNQRMLVTEILEGRRLKVTTTPLREIITLQLGSVLLFSWFEWSWASSREQKTYRVYFNTVSDRIFRELQQCLSSMLTQRESLKNIQGNQGLHYLEDLPYKFKNIIPLRLLLPGEEIQSIVYRPGFWERRVVLFKRQISPATALILTDRQVLVVEEEIVGAEGHHGVITRYIPRHALSQAVLEQQAEGLLLRLLFQVHGVEFEQRLEFEFSSKLQLDHMLNLVGQPIISSKI